MFRNRNIFKQIKCWRNRNILKKLKWRNRNIKINKYVNVGEIEILKKFEMEKQKY